MRGNDVGGGMVQKFSGCRKGRLKDPKGSLKTPQESGRLHSVFSLKSGSVTKQLAEKEKPCKTIF